VDQIVDRTGKEAETLAKRRPGGVLRTGCLLAAAGVASLLMVDIPLPASGATEDAKAARSFVPASDTWIELGGPQSPAASPRSAPDRLQADLLDGAAVARPAAEEAPDAKSWQSRRKVRGGVKQS
jgi:hypothetical protein